MTPPLLALRGAEVRIAAQTLFGPLDVALGAGDRVSLVGRNGAGKSTLLKALAGSVELDDGQRFLQPRTTVTYLEQDLGLPPGGTSRDAVLLGLATSEREGAAWRADIVLEELGMDPEARLERPSGGEARRLALATALVAEPDVLLLDEPTNHLDIAAIEWLEGKLAGLGGALVVISHDRAFLRRLSTATWWLDRGRLHVGAEGFAAFETWSATILEAEEAALARLDKKLEAETHWLHRGVTARRRRNMGRLRRLEELRTERRSVEARTGSVRLEVESGPGGGSLVIEARGIAKAFGGRTIVDGFSTRIMRGDRIGLIGPNGAGKTTLVKLLLGEVPPDAGEVRQGTGLEIARFDQDRAALDPDRTPWEILCPEGGDQVQVGGRWRHVVGYLRDFLFREEQARTPLRVLSGGERNRLLLARILARPANLLVLDEPTNDLDMDTLDLLQETLAEFDGTLIVVSHDRDFLDRLATSTIVFEGPGRVREYAGGYTDYLAQRPPPLPPPAVAPPRRAPTPRPAPTPRGLDAKRARELDRLPDRMTALGTEIAGIEARLADPAFYTRDPEAFGEAARLLDRRRLDLAGLEERWLELEAAREEAAAGGAPPR